MVTEKIAARMRCQWCDPQLGLHPRGLDRLDQRDHVGIAARELFAVEIPVAHRSLPAVVEHCPAQPELLCLRQRAHHLFDGETALITPGAPDRLISGSGPLRLA